MFQKAVSLDFTKNLRNMALFSTLKNWIAFKMFLKVPGIFHSSLLLPYDEFSLNYCDQKINLKSYLTISFLKLICLYKKMENAIQVVAVRINMLIDSALISKEMTSRIHQKVVNLDLRTNLRNVIISYNESNSTFHFPVSATYLYL